ncbi:MAG: hypothetical protein M1834_007559 [Cirrosporium novae-zelandiae]|nr:MAG: hypothetical protein M1834_007559 [Cirrosporium novae-zelandiae]
MPQEHNFVPFAIVTVVICVPTYLLIGSLNTTEGLKFWQELFAALFKHPANAIVRLAKLPGKIFYPDVSRASSRRGSMSSLYAESIDSDYDQKPERLRHRSQSAMNAIAARTGKMPVTRPRTDTMETGKSAEELSKLGELQAKSPDRSDATVRFHGVANNSQAGIQEKTDEMDSQESKADGTTGMKIDGRTIKDRWDRTVLAE